MKKEVTIYDIAKEINTSPTTVSRALKDHHSISKNMIEKIKAKAKEMGYQPNTFAANLRQQKTNIIGVLIPRIDSYFISSAISGIEHVASEAGYHIIISQSLESSKNEVENAKAMFESRVDGLIVSLAADTVKYDHFDPFVKKEIPIVMFDRVVKDIPGTKVIVDNFTAAYKATLHLIQNGCKRIVHVAGDIRRNVYSERYEGYKKALDDNHLSLDENLVITSLLSIDEGYRAAEKIMQMQPRPDAVFTANDITAISCIKAFKKAGIKVPEEIALVGFNNEPSAEIVEPELTSVEHPAYAMGELAAKQLFSQLSGNKSVIAHETITVKTNLMVRKSSLRKLL